MTTKTKRPQSPHQGDIVDGLVNGKPFTGTVTDVHPPEGHADPIRLTIKTANDRVELWCHKDGTALDDTDDFARVVVPSPVATPFRLPTGRWAPQADGTWRIGA